MDAWCRFLSQLPELQGVKSRSFKEHKVDLPKKCPDHRYTNFVVSMDWFDSMRNCRNWIREGHARLIMFDKSLDGLIVLGLDSFYKYKSDGRKWLLLDFVNEYQESFESYIKMCLEALRPKSGNLRAQKADQSRRRSGQ